MNGSSSDRAQVDGDLQFLTDSVCFALLDNESSSNLSTSKGRRSQDGLFMERLESFIDGQLKDIEAFASREQRPLDEVRKLVAVPHAQYIFSLDPSLPSPNSNGSSKDQPVNPISLKSTLSRLSGMLQLLHSSAGLDSLLLVVSPRATAAPTSMVEVSTPDDKKPQPTHTEASWIGGTELGKEFWMGLKGGALNGIRAFRVKSQMRLEADLKSEEQNISDRSVTSQTISTPNTHVPMARIKSGDVKIELNAAVRQALRYASGNPSAEMRWTKPDSLEELYNVQLIGWPSEIHMRNPSNNGVRENRILLDYVRTGKMQFISRNSPEWKVRLRKDHQRILTDPDSGTSMGGILSNTLTASSSNIPPYTGLSLEDMPNRPTYLASELSHVAATKQPSPPTPRSVNESHDIHTSNLSQPISLDNVERRTLKRPLENNSMYQVDGGREPKRPNILSTEHGEEG